MPLPRRKPRKLWSAWWAAWVAAGVIAELIALRRRGRGDTLSAQVWAVLLGVEELGPVGKVGRWVLSGGIVGFFAWLAVHFVTGWV